MKWSEIVTKFRVAITTSSLTMTFSFENHLRNSHLPSKNLPKATSTGTTIVGALFDGGIVLGADTRATEGAWAFLPLERS